MRNIKNVLIVDDDEDDRSLFIDIVKEINDELKIAEEADGDLALKYLEQNRLNPPDIIILDLNMPRINGFQCLELIKKDKELQKIPVIIFSTTSDKSAIEKTYQKGASLFISKPSSIEAIRKVLKKVFELKLDDYLPQPPREKFVVTTSLFYGAI